MQLQGKVALITGGGSGVGAATARRFTAEGARLVLLGRRRKPLEDVAAETGAAICVGDASDAEDAERAVRSAIDDYGRLDILVASAGTGDGGTVSELDDAAWETAIQTNLTSCFVVARAALPHLIERRGSIVVVASMAGMVAAPQNAGYTVAKHAVIGLTRSLARDFGPEGVRVNAVCPSWTRTPMADGAADVVASRRGITREEAYAVLTENAPLRRPAEPGEIAAVCLFLASDEASIITGAAIAADGGSSTVDIGAIAFKE